MTTALTSLRLDAGRPWPAGIASAALLASAALCALVGAEGALEYRRDLLVSEPWRLLSAHLAHFSWSHLGWNALGFGVLGTLCERDGRARFACALGLSALAIPLAVRLVHPELEAYRGLSGLTSAVFGLACAGTVRALWAHRQRAAAATTAALALAFCGLIARSWLSGSALLVDGFGTEVVPVPVAHAIGLVCGVGCALRKENPS